MATGPRKEGVCKIDLSLVQLLAVQSLPQPGVDIELGSQGSNQVPDMVPPTPPCIHLVGYNHCNETSILEYACWNST